MYEGPRSYRSLAGKYLQVNGAAQITSWKDVQVPGAAQIIRTCPSYWYVQTYRDLIYPTCETF